MAVVLVLRGGGAIGFDYSRAANESICEIFFSVDPIFEQKPLATSIVSKISNDLRAANC